MYKEEHTHNQVGKINSVAKLSGLIKFFFSEN